MIGLPSSALKTVGVPIGSVRMLRGRVPNKRPETVQIGSVPMRTTVPGRSHVSFYSVESLRTRSILEHITFCLPFRGGSNYRDYCHYLPDVFCLSIVLFIIIIPIVITHQPPRMIRSAGFIG